MLTSLLLREMLFSLPLYDGNLLCALFLFSPCRSIMKNMLGKYSVVLLQMNNGIYSCTCTSKQQFLTFSNAKQTLPNANRYFFLSQILLQMLKINWKLRKHKFFRCEAIIRNVFRNFFICAFVYAILLPGALFFFQLPHLKLISNGNDDDEMMMMLMLFSYAQPVRVNVYLHKLNFLVHGKHEICLFSIDICKFVCKFMRTPADTRIFNIQCALYYRSDNNNSKKIISQLKSTCPMLV